jgi:CspA family cold shock protein
MPNGAVKWFDDSKGYGFVRLSDGTDAFLHHSAFLDDYLPVKEGQVLEFDLAQGRHGPRAVNVRRPDRVDH